MTTKRAGGGAGRGGPRTSSGRWCPCGPTPSERGDEVAREHEEQVSRSLIVQCHSHPYDPIRHADYYKSLAFLNTSNDADRDDDFPNLRYPKDKSRYAEASQMQQEIMRLLHSVVTSDRERLANKSEWKQLPIQAAGANLNSGTRTTPSGR